MFVVGLPCAAVVGMTLKQVFSSDLAVMVVGGVWMLTFFVTIADATDWLCPRCGKAYFKTWWWHNALTPRCMHCGLPKWSRDPGA